MSVSRPTVVMIHGAFNGGWVFDAWRARFRGGLISTRCLRRRWCYHDCGHKPPRELGTTSALDYAGDLEKSGSARSMRLRSCWAIRWADSWRRCWPRGSMCARWSCWRHPRRGACCRRRRSRSSRRRRCISPHDFWRKRLRPEKWIAAANALDMMPDHDEIFARFVPESGQATFEIMHWALDPEARHPSRSGAR